MAIAREASLYRKVLWRARMVWWRATYALPIDHERAWRWSLYRWLVMRRWWPNTGGKCRVCGVTCDTYPSWPFWAVCPAHCRNHDYQYDHGMGGKFCVHCGEPLPYW